MRNQARLFACLGASLVAVFISGGAAVAQESSGSPSSPAQPSPRATPSNDIKVHGHWTIELRNADGTLASHNEFENALLGSGQSALSTVLGKTATVLEWRLVLSGASQPCLLAGTPAPCEILETQSVVVAPFQQFATLVISPMPGGTLELQGNITAPAAGSIDSVSSTLATSGTVVPFSQRVLATPIAVAAGQQVYVKVTFSFS
jgi:hypothetical protein